IERRQRAAQLRHFQYFYAKLSTGRFALDFWTDANRTHPYACHEDSLGPGHHRFRDRPRDGLDRDAMDGGGAGLPTAAQPAVVHAGRLADLSALRLLHLDVLLRCLCAEDI